MDELFATGTEPKQGEFTFERDGVSPDVEMRLTLIARAKAGSAAAFNAYVELNRGLLETTINRYKRHMVDADEIRDLRQEALVGLMKGIQNFNLELNGNRKPEGYVFSWVRAMVAEYAREYGRRAREKEAPMAITVGSDEDDTLSLCEVCADEREDVHQAVHDMQVTGIIRNVVENLLPKEKLIARRRIFSDDPATLEKLGAELGVSRERVRQIEERIALKCRRRLAPRLREMYGITRGVAA